MRYIFVAVLCLAGCEGPQGTTIEDNRDKAVNACIAQGGVPITSAWDGRVLDCRFPPGKGLRPEVTK